MTDEFLPFSRPFISEAAIDDVVTCLKSGWITTGPKVAEFTEALKTYFKAPYVLPLMSATSGLHFSLLALDLQPGDEVITTPLTFAATLNTIVLAGGTPVLIDIDPDTLNMDLNLLEQAITKNTRAIMPVHFAGLPLDLTFLYEMADKYGLRVIEDAAHAMGSEYAGERIGSMGDIQVFSFHPTKNMTTIEGGCVVTRDPQIAEQIAKLRFHGIDRQAWNRYGKSGTQDYEVVLPGYKSNMTDVQAVIGIHQLRELDHFIIRRNELANRYQEALSDWEEWILPKHPAYEHLHSWHIYTPCLNQEATHLSRDAFIQAMKEKNIGTGLHYRAVHLYPFYRDTFSFQPGDFPVAESVCDRIVSLPLFPTMTDAEHDRVLDVMYQVFHETNSYQSTETINYNASAS